MYVKFGENPYVSLIVQNKPKLKSQKTLHAEFFKLLKVFEQNPIILSLDNRRVSRFFRIGGQLISQQTRTSYVVMQGVLSVMNLREQQESMLKKVIEVNN